MILRMILVICDNVSVFLFGGLQHVFGMCYHLFPYVPTCIITYVTITIWKFCTIFNAVPLLICYLMHCCLPYPALWHHIGVNFNVLPCITIKFFKKSILISLYEKMMVRHSNASENLQFCTHFTENVKTFSSTSG